jgi:hypothetical protein
MASGKSRLSAVVNYRVDYKQFVLWYCSEPKVTLYAIICAERSVGFVIRLQDELNHVIFCEHYTTVAFDVCFLMITHLNTVSCN